MWGFEIQSLRGAFLLSLLCLGSCSSYQTDFDCDVARGVPCTSLSDISALIDEGEFPQGEFAEKTHPKEHSQRASKTDHAKEEPCCDSCANKAGGDACAKNQKKGEPHALRELVFLPPNGGVERYEI